MTDYLYHITGISEEKLKEIPEDQVYGEKDIEIIQNHIKGKIVCGHDLANDLKLLKITHSAFIDTVALFPHVFGLPLKNKLKDLARNYLNRIIQWSFHDPQEDAVAVLDLITSHCENGRGIIEIEEFPKK